MSLPCHSAVRALTLAFLLCCSPLASPAITTAVLGRTVVEAAQAGASVAPLSQAELETLLPATVYYLNKTAPVQVRNAAGFRFPGSGNFLAAMVDSSGYSTAIQESYQFYILTENSVRIGGQRLPAGAYGAGFVNGKLAIMDIGGHPVLETAAQQDAALARPRPMQIVPASNGVKLYHGRQWVTVAPATAP